ncbi:Uncharacterized protein SCF082_LOCUS49137 [Durusdinium trenchii]|uniref:Uncharacterized protein n=1 Tax=Durusdinium trenchii TaxID=1381693 RepID=A0ABP0RZB9_9DINO
MALAQEKALAELRDTPQQQASWATPQHRAIPKAMEKPDDDVLVADRVLGMWKDGLLDSDTAAQILGQAALDMASPAAAPSSASAPDVLDARKRAHIEIEKVAEDQEQDDLDKDHNALKAKLRRLMTPNKNGELKDKFIKMKENSVTKSDKTVSDVECGWYSKEDMLKLLKWPACRAKDTFQKHIDGVLQKISKLRSLVADLQKNYVAEGAPHLSIKAINVDLEALDKDYTILSDHMAKGERDNFNEAWNKETEAVMKASTFTCSKILQNEAKIRLGAQVQLEQLRSALLPTLAKEPQTQTYSYHCTVAIASCKSQILTAKAVVEDVGDVPAAKCGMDHWSNCSLKNSERDAQKVMTIQKSKLDVPVSHLVFNGTSIPWIDPRDWARWILRMGLWPTLSGAPRNDYVSSEGIWRQFWKQYRELCPDFSLFRMEGIDLAKTAGICLHGDEGTSLKRQGIMVCNWQSILGRGFDDKRVPRVDDRGVWQMRVNFTGHTHTHRLLLVCMPKKLYEADSSVFHFVMEQISLAFKDLLTSGIQDPVTKEVLRFAVICAKGDAPFLSKLGTLFRSFNSFAKRGDARRPPKGVCHRCLAGTTGFPAEELSTRHPRWLDTRGVKMPWVQTPAVILHLPHDEHDPSSFFASDCFHIFHLGVGKSWISSVVMLLLEVLPGSNIDAQYDYLSSSYLHWCKRNKQQSHVHALTQHLMSHNDYTGLTGNWHKGALTTSLMRFLTDFIPQLQVDQRQLLPECLQASKAVNQMYSVMFRAAAFLTKEECTKVADAGFLFLATYAKMALIQYHVGKPHAFPLYPKLHALAEILCTVHYDSLRVGYALNPICHSCQMDEDSTGRTARLSRHVNSRRVMARTIDRWLVGACAAFRDAGLII